MLAAGTLELIKQHNLALISLARGGVSSATDDGGAPSTALTLEELLINGSTSAAQKRYGYTTKALPCVGGPRSSGELAIKAPCIGQGAFGVCYLGAAPDTNSLLALKFFTERDAPEAMQRELRFVLRDTRHTVFAPPRVAFLGTQRTPPAVGYAFASGMSLDVAARATRQDGRLEMFGPTWWNLQYEMQLLGGRASALGMIHQDIKAANILVDSSLAGYAPDGTPIYAHKPMFGDGGCGQMVDEHWAGPEGNPMGQSPEAFVRHALGPKSDMPALNFVQLALDLGSEHFDALAKFPHSMARALRADLEAGNLCITAGMVARGLDPCLPSHRAAHTVRLWAWTVGMADDPDVRGTFSHLARVHGAASEVLVASMQVAPKVSEHELDELVMRMLLVVAEVPALVSLGMRERLSIVYTMHYRLWSERRKGVLRGVEFKPVYTESILSAGHLPDTIISHIAFHARFEGTPYNEADPAYASYRCPGWSFDPLVLIRGWAPAAALWTQGFDMKRAGEASVAWLGEALNRHLGGHEELMGWADLDHFVDDCLPSVATAFQGLLYHRQAPAGGAPAREAAWFAMDRVAGVLLPPGPAPAGEAAFREVEAQAAALAALCDHAGGIITLAANMPGRPGDIPHAGIYMAGGMLLFADTQRQLLQAALIQGASSDAEGDARVERVRLGAEAAGSALATRAGFLQLPGQACAIDDCLADLAQTAFLAAVPCCEAAYLRAAHAPLAAEQQAAPAPALPPAAPMPGFGALPPAPQQGDPQALRKLMADAQLQQQQRALQAAQTNLAAKLGALQQRYTSTMARAVSLPPAAPAPPCDQELDRVDSNPSVVAAAARRGSSGGTSGSEDGSARPSQAAEPAPHGRMLAAEVTALFNGLRVSSTAGQASRPAAAARGSGRRGRPGDALAGPAPKRAQAGGRRHRGKAGRVLAPIAEEAPAAAGLPHHLAGPSVASLVPTDGNPRSSSKVNCDTLDRMIEDVLSRDPEVPWQLAVRLAGDARKQQSVERMLLFPPGGLGSKPFCHTEFQLSLAKATDRLLRSIFKSLAGSGAARAAFAASQGLEVAQLDALWLQLPDIIEVKLECLLPRGASPAACLAMPTAVKRACFDKHGDGLSVPQALAKGHTESAAKAAALLEEPGRGQRSFTYLQPAALAALAARAADAALPHADRKAAATQLQAAQRALLKVMSQCGGKLPLQTEVGAVTVSVRLDPQQPLVRRSIPSSAATAWYDLMVRVG